MGSARHQNLGQRLDGLRRWQDVLTILGGVVTVVLLLILILVAISQNARMEQLTKEVKNQTTTIERVVKATNQRGMRSTDRILRICEAVKANCEPEPEP